MPDSVSSIPPERFPPRLASLGYAAHISDGIEVIVPPLSEVPAGAFLMGSDPNQDKQAEDNEKPQHWVTVPAFQIARFPVTVAEWACFMRDEHAEPKDTARSRLWKAQIEQRLDHPIVFVSWHDAVAYAAWLAQRTGQPWRLPSEAEWEKAVRGTHGRIYPWGDTFDKARANTSEGGKVGTTPVGTYPNGASPCGAQDMAGNVWEWTSSLDKLYPYSASDGREAPDSTNSRVLCGGSWIGTAGFARAAFRLGRPGGDFGYIGFRVVRAVPSQSV